jgi:uncharacterized protein (TIGR04255 family)
MGKKNSEGLTSAPAPVMERSEGRRRSPVVQAELNLYVPDQRATSLETLSRMQGPLREEYPERRLWSYDRGAFGEEELLTQPELPVVGYAFSNPRRPFILQVRVDGMAVVQLPPYKGWDVLRAEARRQWEFYRSIVLPEQVGGIAVRFVNRFDFPTPVGKLSEYFDTFPHVSDRILFNALSDFAMNVELPQEDMEAVVLIGQRTVPPPAPFEASIMLSISVVYNGNLSDEEELWNVVERLHHREREVFDACIGPRSREGIA